MSPYGLLVLEVLLMVGAFVVATLKSRDGLLDWVKWFGGVFVVGNVCLGLLKLMVVLSGGGEAA